MKWTLLALLLLALTGCSEPPKPFRVGTNIWIGYEPLYLAQGLGLLDGGNIRLVTMSNATEVQRAFRAGTLEAAALTLDETLNLLQDGFPVRVVLVMDFSSGGDVLLARPGIAALADLKGQRVGVESTAVGAVMLSAALQAGGLSTADITLTYLTIDEHEKAFESGIVDALVTFDPVRSLLLKRGARLLFDSSKIPERIVDVLVVRPDVADAFGDEIKHLVKGHFAAVKYLQDHPEQAAGMMVGRQGIDATAILDAYQGIRIPGLEDNRRLLKRSDPGLAKAAAELSALMTAQQLLQHQVNTDGLFDDRWLPR